VSEQPRIVSVDITHLVHAALAADQERSRPAEAAGSGA
jgi:hypothetical protein